MAAFIARRATDERRPDRCGGAILHGSSAGALPTVQAGHRTDHDRLRSRVAYHSYFSYHSQGSPATDHRIVKISNLWKPFGLRSDPFFQEELRTGDTEHPVDLFVGRDAELRRLSRRLGVGRSTRSVIAGEPGVGKTSFLNRLKADASGAGFLTYAHPIRIQSGMTAAGFVADTLRLLLRIRLGAGLSNSEERFWSRTAKLLEGGELVGGNVGALGIGAGVTRAAVEPQLPADSLYEHLGEALDRITTEAGSDVLVHVNNLENLTDEDATEAAGIVRDLRDHLMLPGAHWMFVGASGVDAIFRRFAQVDGIFPAAEVLAPLSTESLVALLERRYEHLTTGEVPLVPPIEAETAARLYDLYAGDLRNFLRLLGDAAESVLGLDGARPMTEAEVVRHTAPEYRRHLAAQIGGGDAEHLARLIAASGDVIEFRVTDVARVLGMKQSSASQLVERLQRARAIRRDRTEGKSVFYRPVGAALIAYGVLEG